VSPRIERAEPTASQSVIRNRVRTCAVLVSQRAADHDPRCRGRGPRWTWCDSNRCRATQRVLGRSGRSRGQRVLRVVVTLTRDVIPESGPRSHSISTPLHRPSSRSRSAPTSDRSRPTLRGVPGEASVTDRLPGDAVDGVKGSRVPGAGSMVSTTRVARSSNRVAGEAVRMRIVNRMFAVSINALRRGADEVHVDLLRVAQSPALAAGTSGESPPRSAHQSDHAQGSQRAPPGPKRSPI
jgi:hypothetical protein